MITPHEQYNNLATELGYASTDLYFKREDLHPYGSHKGRSIPNMIDHYHASGVSAFAIASSGNAALAAARKVAEHVHANPSDPIRLTIFVGHSINPTKFAALKNLESEYITVTQTLRPLQALFNATADGTVKSLRQSTDDYALVGYHELAKELLSIPKLTDVFIPTSSGTTAQSLAEYFASHSAAVRVHIIQTTACHPLVDALETVDTGTHLEPSIADAIVDQIATRKGPLAKAFSTTHGHGYVATNDDITRAIELTRQSTGLTISPNSALSVAGLILSSYTGEQFAGAVACIITGK